MPLRRPHSVTQKNEVFFLVDANSQRNTALFTRPRPVADSQQQSNNMVSSQKPYNYAFRCLTQAGIEHGN